jgi:hypothetical protein
LILLEETTRCWKRRIENDQRSRRGRH